MRWTAGRRHGNHVPIQIETGRDDVQVSEGLVRRPTGGVVVERCHVLKRVENAAKETVRTVRQRRPTRALCHPIVTPARVIVELYRLYTGWRNGHDTARRVVIDRGHASGGA